MTRPATSRATSIPTAWSGSASTPALGRRGEGLVDEHVRETQSRFAARLLNDWALERGKFWQVVPKEMLTRLAHPLDDAAAEKRA